MFFESFFANVISLQVTGVKFLLLDHCIFTLNLHKILAKDIYGTYAVFQDVRCTNSANKSCFVLITNVNPGPIEDTVWYLFTFDK